jgi:hypothetical protein
MIQRRMVGGKTRVLGYEEREGDKVFRRYKTPSGKYVAVDTWPEDETGRGLTPMANEAPTPEARLAEMIKARDLNIGPCCHDFCLTNRLTDDHRAVIVKALREAEFAERRRWCAP